MPKAARSPQDRLSSLEQQKAQLEARIAKERSRVRAVERKKDTRRKIIAGALALEHADHDPAFKAALDELLKQHVTRPEDRALFELPG